MLGYSRRMQCTCQAVVGHPIAHIYLISNKALMISLSQLAFSAINCYNAVLDSDSSFY